MQGKPSKKQDIIADPSALHAWNEEWQEQPRQALF